MSITSGWKTYAAAAGLFGLALYLVTKQPPDYLGAWQTLMAALAAAGLRHAVSRAKS